jgi:tetratricopeptide (TPR) repeat protein
MTSALARCALCAALILPVALPSVPGEGGGAPDTGFESIARNGIKHVYNLEFESAEKEFQELTRLRPGDPAGYFFLAMVQWWRIMIDIDDESNDAQFYAALDGVIGMCDSLLDKRPDDVNAIFFKGGAIGFEGRLKFHRNDYLGAASAGKKALPLVREARDLDPGNSDILLGAGIYDSYADVIPSEYPFVKPFTLFLPPGDRQKGLRELETASENGKYASVEAQYFLLQIEYFYEKDFTRALALAVDLHAKFPANMVFHRYAGRAYVAVNNWESARTEFAEIIARARSGMRGYTPPVEREAEYYCGMAAMLARRFEEALGDFERCDAISRQIDRGEASGFMAMANLKMGMVYDLEGKRDLALVEYRKVREMANYQDSRDLAKQYLDSPYTR